MNLSRINFLALCSLNVVLAQSVVACSSDTGGTLGDGVGGASMGGAMVALGGSAASGVGGGSNPVGTTEVMGVGGGVGIGGAIGAGGASVVSTGGALGAGGALGTGGTTAKGGTTSTGGSTAKGGATGTGGTTANFWKNVTYSATGLPDVPSGEHNVGRDCVSCHTGATQAPRWYFAGTVYQANGTTPAVSAQIGVNDGTNLYTAYSARNGNFYLRTTAAINWATAQVRVRNANGERIMSGATPAAGCNSCHNGTTEPRITAP